MLQFPITLAHLLNFTSIVLLITYHTFHHFHYLIDPSLQTTILITSDPQPLGQPINKIKQPPQPLILFLHCLEGHPFSVILLDLSLNETNWVVEEGRTHFICDYAFSVLGGTASNEEVYSFGLCDYLVLLCYYFLDQ